jgi:hypothetical protein
MVYAQQTGFLDTILEEDEVDSSAGGTEDYRSGHGMNKEFAWRKTDAGEPVYLYLLNKERRVNNLVRLAATSNGTRLLGTGHHWASGNVGPVSMALQRDTSIGSEIPQSVYTCN